MLSSMTSRSTVTAGVSRSASAVMTASSRAMPLRGAWRERDSLDRTDDAVEGLLEAGVGLGPAEDRGRLDGGTARLAQADDEGGRSRDAQLHAVLKTLPHLRRVLSALQALFEARHVEPDGAGVLDKILVVQRGLAIEQPIVHRPVFALLAGAVGRLGGLERLRMKTLQGKIAKDVFHLAGL